MTGRIRAHPMGLPALGRGRWIASPRCRQMGTLLQLASRHDCAILRTLRGSPGCGHPRRTQNGAHHDELGRSRDRDSPRRPGRAHGNGRPDFRHCTVALESPGGLAHARQSAPGRPSAIPRFTPSRRIAALIGLQFGTEMADLHVDQGAFRARERRVPTPPRIAQP